MSFLFPSFLWGLLAVLAPLIIHLFNFRKTKRVLFTNVSFLREVETRTSSFRRLKQLLILLARMLALACLALAFAQPYLRQDSQPAAARGQGIVGLYLDNSYSMQNEENSKRYIDVATGYLNDLLGLFKNLPSLQLVTNDFSSGELGLATADKIRDRLTMIDLSYNGRTLEEVYKRQQRLTAGLSSTGGGNHYFWISDFQKSTAGDLMRLQVDSTDFVTIVPVQATLKRNIYIDSAWLASPFVRELQHNSIYVRIRSSGNEPVEDLVVKLYLDDMQVSTASVDVAANGTAEAKFNFNLKGSGFKKGKISFDDFPVTFDNDYYFVLNASPVIRIFYLQGIAGGQRYIETVYHNDSLFRLERFQVGNADLGKIGLSDLVIWEGVDQPSEALMAGVTNFVRKGGSLMVVPPRTSGTGPYEHFLQQFGIHGLTAAGSQGLVPLNMPDARIPFFSDVFEESVRGENNVNMPAAARTWSWSAGGSNLLTLRDGAPFLTQVSYGDGKVYVLAGGFEASSGNFAQHALFVPVMYKIAASSVRARQTAYTFGEGVIELPMAEASPNTLYKLRQGDTELIPGQRLVGNKLVMELPKRQDLGGQAAEAGYYELWGDEKLASVVAFNYEQAESEMDYYSPDELKRIFEGKKNFKVLDTIGDGKLAAEFEKQAGGKRLWQYFIYAALAFLLAEILLIRFMKGEV